MFNFKIVDKQKCQQTTLPKTDILNYFHIGNQQYKYKQHAKICSFAEKNNLY